MTLQEKPDFEKITLEGDPGWNCVCRPAVEKNPEMYVASRGQLLDTIEKLWSSHVEPLQKENERLKEENTGLINMLMQANAELENISKRGN